MAERLNDRELGPRYFKLTFPGGSIYSALDIIRQSGKKPEVVLVETNVLNRGTDPELLHDLFTPWLYQVRRHSRIFREEGRPANFAGGIAEACVRKLCQKTDRLVYGEDVEASAAANKLDPKFRAKILQVERAGQEAAPSEQLLKQRTAELGDAVDALTREGVTCILFEMPVDSSLADLSWPRAWRQAVDERFPKSEYHWLTFPRDHNYETSDGVHLVQEEADRLTEVVLRQVDQIRSQSADLKAAGQANRLRGPQTANNR